MEGTNDQLLFELSTKEIFFSLFEFAESLECVGRSVGRQTPKEEAFTPRREEKSLEARLVVKKFF